jgi:phasin family protein
LPRLRQIRYRRTIRGGNQSQQETTMAEETTTLTGNNSPFALAMGQAKKASEEFTRLFSEMKVPGAEALTAAHKRNIEAITAANRIALEGAQAVAKRHMEIVQQTITEMNETVRSLASSEAPHAKAARQAELLKQAYEHAVSNTREISDLIQHSNKEALDLLNSRFLEAMDEVKSLMDKGANRSA